MAYYIIRYQRKSHSDRPMPWGEETIECAPEQLDERVRSITKGCEDWTIKEVNHETYKDRIFDRGI